MSYHSAAIAAALKSATAPLTAERERELCIRWRDQRDARARDLVTRSQLPYIVRRATTFAKHSQLDVDELFACGCEGLAQALARFDPDHGVRVVTYASKWINAAMRDAIAFHGSIFGSRTNKRATQWIHRLHGTARRIFASEDPERETIEFIRSTPHERLRKMHPRLVRHVLRLAYCGRATSMDEADESQSTMHDALADTSPGADERIAEAEQGEQIVAALRVLNPREVRILRETLLCDGDDARSFREIGVDLGVSRVRVQQIQARALEKLRTAMAG